MTKINNWGGANEHKRLVQKLCEKVFKKRGYENQKDATRDGLTFQGNNRHEAIEQLFEINEILPSVCKGGSKFDVEDFHRSILTQTLHKKARVEFVKQGRHDLRDEGDVPDLLEEIQDGIEAEMQIKHANRRHNNNNFKKNDDASARDNDSNNKNWCRKKGHNHKWKNCPDNPKSMNYKGDDSRQREDRGGARRILVCFYVREGM